MIAYFMGVWPGERAGHYCRRPNGIWATASDPASPWGSAHDALGDVAPMRAAWPECYDAGGYTQGAETQPEGRARVVRQDGWTLVAMWDRSADGRGGCMAAMAIRADLAPEAALATAREAFPKVFERIEQHLGKAVVLDTGRWW